MNKEKIRLKEINKWRKWGPYISERQWGTVREDYSQNGDAWNYITHDMSRSYTYRWGEEGIAGISDENQLLCFAPAFWNGKDPVLKENFFGLTNPQGNHGEDVKEYYYYLDNLPSHSYMKFLYKYPHEEFPYHKLWEENRNRNKEQEEFELIDTGIFDDDQYFDIFIEYAKAGPEDILIRITAFNRGKNKADLYIIPQTWFRNTWSFGNDKYKPKINHENNFLKINHKETGEYFLYYEKKPDVLFCDNETNAKRLSGKSKDGFFKDGVNEYIVHGKNNVLNKYEGTKAALNYFKIVQGGGSFEVKLRLVKTRIEQPFQKFDLHFIEKIKEADEFYKEIQNEIENNDEKNIQRQAFAGMLWSKQFYYYNNSQWLNGDPAKPNPPTERRFGRNAEWFHLDNADIISMPDKWEYPWYATWDVAFHCIALAMIDPEFAKEQLLLFTKEWYMHPNGQLPAYEWDFSDVNPPVHAWAVWRVYKIDEKNSGKGDVEFLERVFHKLLLNFTWWVNKKDKDGRNIFQGGFLGMDNIGVFDRSKLPTNGHIDQSDATSWVAMYSLNLMRIALELSLTKPLYQDLASKFFEHFLYIAKAMTNIGGEGIGLWDDEDEFYYDVLHTEQGNSVKLKVRSMVGLIPLFAVEVLDPEIMKHTPEFEKRLNWFLENKSDLANLVSRWCEVGIGERNLLSLLRGHRMKRLFKRLLNEEEFLSEYGIRSLSKVYENEPFIFHSNDAEFKVKYTPAESDTRLFGGNSNWRGPIWFPVNFLIIESMQRFHHYYGDDFKIEYPDNSGNFITISEASEELTKRLKSIFLRNGEGKRPVFGNNKKFQENHHFKDYILFYEYFNGDDGSGLGASHQTGWTGLIAKLLQPRREEKSN